MARQPRIEVTGGYYHVFARGNERRALYRDDNDRTSFLELVGTTLEGYAWELLSYVLMRNHYHLLVQTSEPNLSAGMHYLNAVYAQRFNRRHRRVGHLYQGRYKARLVQGDERLLATIRYIVRNPVRARLCARPDQWRWSSQRAILGLAPPGLVATTAVLARFHHDRQKARRLYRAFTHDDDGPAPASHPLIDGDQPFTQDHLQLINPSPEHPAATLRPTPTSLDTLLPVHPTTDQLATARDAGHTITAIANHLNLHKSTISRRLKHATAET
jgi:REP-associated tyrosine transposase